MNTYIVVVIQYNKALLNITYSHYSTIPSLSLTFKLQKMPKQQKVTRWNIGTNVSKTSGLVMAEPQHRLFNRGDSNISINQFPSSKSSAQQIKDICLHYVNKCSGQYIHNRTSARYVHQMADEVLNQISGLISQISRIESEPEAYQALLQDFKDSFPPNLTSPKQVAAKLNQLQHDYDQAIITITSLKQNHKKELETIAASVNDQIKAHKDGILKERRHHKSKLDDISFECNQKLIDERTRIINEKNEMEQQFLQQIHTLQTNYTIEINKLQTKLKSLEKELIKTKDELENIDDDNKEKEVEISQLKSKIRRYEDEDLLNSSRRSSEYGLGSARMSDAGSVVIDDDDDDKSFISNYSYAATVETFTTADNTASNIATNVDKATNPTNSTDNAIATTSTTKSSEGGGQLTGGGQKVNESHRRVHSSSRERSGSSSGGGSGNQYIKIAKSLKKVRQFICNTFTISFS